jgi:hypothetical protein
VRNRHEELVARFAAAYMDLRLRDLPPSVAATVERTADYIAKLGEDRTPRAEGGMESGPRCFDGIR